MAKKPVVGARKGDRSLPEVTVRAGTARRPAVRSRSESIEVPRRPDHAVRTRREAEAPTGADRRGDVERPARSAVRRSPAGGATESMNRSRANDSTLQIFLSHKMGRDGQVAKGIAAALGAHGGNRVVVHCSSEFRAGDKWKQKVNDCLLASNWLILLYTDEDETWDWCLYEVGRFDSIENVHDKRIICIHDPRVAIPSPLNDYNAIGATEAKVTEFLRLVYDNHSPECWGISPRLFEPSNADMLRGLSRKIVEAVTKKGDGEPSYYSTTLRVDILPHMLEEWRRGKIPDGAVVTGTGAWERAFGHPRTNSRTWCDLTCKSPQREYWLPLITEMFRLAEADTEIPPTIMLFRPSPGSPVFRPIMHRFDRRADGELRFTLILSEVPLSDEFDSTDRLAVMHQLVHLAWHFRRMLYDRFYHVVREHEHDRKLGDHAVRELYAKLGTAIDTLHVDSYARGVERFGQIMEAFGSQEDREVISAAMQAWEPAETRLRQGLSAGAAGIKVVRESLQQLGEINREFYVRSTARVAELVNDAFSGTGDRLIEPKGRAASPAR